MVNLLDAYCIYNKYWISRKFIDVFGFNFLTNNLYIINKFLNYSDLGTLKKIYWTKLGLEQDDGTVKKYDKSVEALDFSCQQHIKYHEELVMSGLMQRKDHFIRCQIQLASFNELFNLSLIDNIYEINENLKKYIPNFFEDILIRNFELKPCHYKDFVDIIIEEMPDKEYLNKDLEFDFEETECSR